MKAIAFEQTGDIDVLTQMDLPRPTTEPGHVVIRVVAAGVNPADTVFRRGDIPFVRLSYPFIPGLDAAGVVEEVGAGVSGVQVGDAVYGMLPNAQMGGYAEYAALSSEAIAPIPPGVTFTEAAAVPTAALTALQALRDNIGLAEGDRLLINGGSGGVGHFAIQIAKAMGAHVTATASASNLDLLRDLGADVTINYRETPVESLEQQFDAVFDAVGVLRYGQVHGLLRRGGAGATVSPVKGNPLVGLWARFGGRRWSSLFASATTADLQTLNGWLADGQVRPVINTCYPLAEAAEAQRYSESKRAYGKLVLTVDEALASQAPA